MKPCLRFATTLAVLGASTMLFSQQGWTVKPEWVRAHENFLASDVLAGRGSATRDEELTATYVASEFEGYGLKPAPGMTGYLQAAEVIAPKLDGQATLQAGDATLKEGADFVLLTSTGAAATGKLARVAAADVQAAHVADGAVVLTGAADMKALMPAMQALRKQGADVILVPETPGLSALPQMFGGETRVSMRLAEMAPRKSPTVVLVHAEAASKLPAGDGAEVTVTVHAVPETKPRKTFNAIGYLEGTDPAAGTLLLTRAPRPPWRRAAGEW